MAFRSKSTLLLCRNCCKFQHYYLLHFHKKTCFFLYQLDNFCFCFVFEKSVGVGPTKARQGMSLLRFEKRTFYIVLYVFIISYTTSLF